jgi:hypothetical protein
MMLVGYAYVNFRLEGRATLGGHIETMNGIRALVVHGQRVRELGPAEVRALEAWNVRVPSGDLLPFLLRPGLALVFVLPAGRSANTIPEQSNESLRPPGEHR